MTYIYRTLRWLTGAFLYCFLSSCSTNQSTGSNPAAATTIVGECSERFSHYSDTHQDIQNPVRSTQNFILTELLNDRIECAKSIAGNSDNEVFRDYFVGLAYYFDFGNQDSYITAFKALRNFSLDDGACLMKVWDELGSYNHIDCGANFILLSFVLLETDNITFMTKSGMPSAHEQTQHIFWSGLQLTLTGLPGLYKFNRDKYGPPRSLLIDEKNIAPYLKNMLKVYWSLTYRIAKSAEESTEGEFIVFGNPVGKAKRDHAFWTDMKFNISAREIIEDSHAQLVKLYYSEADLASGNYLGNDPATYCEARLFIFNLIFEGNFQIEDMKNTKPYEKCLSYHESRWN